MSSPHRSLSDRLMVCPWMPVSGPATVGEYADEFCRPLQGIIEYCQISEYRLQVAAQLAELVEEFHEAGCSRQTALFAAMREHGDAYLMGTLLRREILRDNRPCFGFVRMPASTLQGMAAWFFVYLTLAALLLLGPPHPMLPPVAFVASSFAVGHLVGSVAAAQPYRPLLWGSIAAVYPLVLTSLLIVIQSDVPTACGWMPIWLTMLTATAVHRWRTV